MNTKILLVVTIVLSIVASVAVFGVYHRYQQLLRPLSDDETQHYINIEPGMSSSAVAETLREENLIRSAFAFRMYARVHNLSHLMQAGFYSLSPSMSVADILDVLTEGQVASLTVRIPGGSDLKEITGIFEDAGFSAEEIEIALGAEYDNPVLSDKPSSEGLEGYLFPDTYHIAANASLKELIEMVLANTELHLGLEVLEEWKKHGLDIHQGLTLASIVQKEAGEPQIQSQVAQVFLTRLDRGMRLEADPTYIYAARQMDVPASPELRSPYNTYRTDGLPPGPISTTEAGAINAVAHPATTDYLYFVTGKDGVTRFSKTKAEHQGYIDEHGVSGA